jgi:hypothetical protein
MAEMHRGPYAFVNPMVAIRVDSNAAGVVDLIVKSNFWPVTIDWGAGDPEEVTEAEAATTVEHDYAADDTFTIEVTCPKGATDTVDVTTTGS